MTTLRGRFDPRQVVPPVSPVDAGQRVVLIEVDETEHRARYVRGYRTVPGPDLDTSGRRVVAVVSEAVWPTCRVTCSTHCAHRRLVPAELIWPE